MPAHGTLTVHTYTLIHKPRENNTQNTHNTLRHNHELTYNMYVRNMHVDTHHTLRTKHTTHTIPGLATQSPGKGRCSLSDDIEGDPHQ